MKALVLLMALALTGCATVPVTKYVMPTPPANYMIPPKTLQPIKPNADGTVSPRDALATVIKNNTISKQNAEVLQSLQAWILATEKNVKDSK